MFRHITKCRRKSLSKCLEERSIGSIASYTLDRVGFARGLWGREWNAAPRLGFRKGDRGFEIFANEWFSWTGDLSAISHGKGNKSRHVDASDWLWVMAGFQSLDTRGTFAEFSNGKRRKSPLFLLAHAIGEHRSQRKEEGHRANRVALEYYK